jgi:hypothetical protein
VADVALNPVAPVTAAPSGTATRSATWLTTGAVASLGAGAVHAAAIGVHAETRPAAIAFTVLATVQLAWGALALVRSGRLVSLLGLASGAAAVAGWLVAKTSGIPFIEGLEDAEAIQTADALAAGLALLSLLAVAFSMFRWSLGAPSLQVSALLVAALTVPGLLAAGQHDHGGGAGHGNDGGTTAAAGDGHDHGTEASTDDQAAGADHHAMAAEPVAYDPSKPLDFGGIEGVTPEQQARAENLVAVTLSRLPQWSDPAVAEAAGFRTIGDGRTGVEHLIHSGYMNDDVILDPDQPESLVYDTSEGGRKLVAAMYMVKPGTPLDAVPDIGGSLTQWHVHDNLCYNAQGRVAGLTDSAGNCAPGLIKPVETPMIHVWIEPHRCGPFAALEGIGGGRIPEGETKLCDHAHGA